MKNRRTLRLALPLLLLGTLAHSQETPDPFLLEKALPPETLFYFSVPNDEARGAEYAKSNIHRFFQNPEIRSFLEPLENYLGKRKDQQRQFQGMVQPSWNETVRGAVGLTLDELYDLVKGPIAFAVVDLPVNEQHSLELVLSLGAKDPASIENAYAKFREHIKRQSGRVSESERTYRDRKIHRFGDDEFSVYHAVVGGNVVLTTSASGIESVLDTLAGKESETLSGHAPFRTVRGYASPGNRHLFFGYLGVESIADTFEKELGDQMLDVFERLGILDVTAVGGALCYESARLRERYAAATSRQDRGIVKILARPSGPDPAARFVPKGAFYYSHADVSLCDYHDLVFEVAGTDEQAEKSLRETIRKYEQRVGVDIRADLIETLGTSWTAYASFPEAGGAYPDLVMIAQLKDGPKFLAALDRVILDAGWGVDETEFRGQKIRLVQISFEPTGAELPPGMEALTFLSVPVCCFERDGFLFLSMNPLALKRQVLRIVEKRPTIGEDERFAAARASFDAANGNFMYLDIGRAVTFAYNSVEPLAHFGREFLRDETGEQFLDLARLPLGETLGELLGAAYAVRRVEKDAVVVECDSNVALTTVSTAVATSMMAAVAIPMLMYRRHDPESMPDLVMGAAGNERMAELALRSIAMAQETFRNSDMDGNGVADYWTRDVAGLYALKDRNGDEVYLIDPRTAAADQAGGPGYDSLKAKVAAKNGYWFGVPKKDPEGEPYGQDPDKDGDASTNRKRWAVAAYPAVYGASGRATFLVTEEGTVWKKDTLGEPVEQCPKEPEKEGWKRMD